MASTPPRGAPATPATPAPPSPPPPDVPEEIVRAWRSEFDAHDESGVGRVDAQSLSFALAKLRLLEDVDVEQAARTLESKLVQLGRDPAAEGGFDFDAFRWFASALLALREASDVCPSAKPVPVRREFVFDDAHPFAAHFAGVASDGEIDGETFAAHLRAAGLVDGTILSDTGVDVIFARAKARHVGGKEGALSHLPGRALAHRGTRRAGLRRRRRAVDRDGKRCAPRDETRRGRGPGEGSGRDADDPGRRARGDGCGGEGVGVGVDVGEEKIEVRFALRNVGDVEVRLSETCASRFVASARE